MRYKGILILIAVFSAFSLAYANHPEEKAYLFRYSFTIKEIPAQAKEIRIWTPYPARNPFQKVNDLSVKNQLTGLMTDTRYGNRMLYSVIKDPKTTTLSVERVYRIRRKEFVNKPVMSGYNARPAKSLPESKLSLYNDQDAFIPVTDYVRKLAAQITTGKTTGIERARAIYDFLFKNMTYDKTTPGWGKGDIERVCFLLKGNCTDFHSFFIALCRACGIPAKFVIGVPLTQKSGEALTGYHCWAEFYTPEYGWAPVDVSEAWKNKSKYEYFFGALDSNRVEFSHGRGIRLEPAQRGDPLDYFIFPYVEIDGKAFDNVETNFSYEAVL